MKRIIAMLLAVMMLVSTPMEMLASEVSGTPIVTESTDVAEDTDVEEESVESTEEDVVDVVEPTETEDVDVEEPTETEETTEIPEAEVEETEEVEETLVMPDLGDGVIELELIEVDGLAGKEFDSESVVKNSKYRPIYSEWDNYASQYYYNQLSDKYKEIWDEMDLMCWLYMYLDEDAYYDYIPGVGYTYYIGGINMGNMSYDEMYSLAYLFEYANPQYYFIDNLLLSSSYGNTKYLYLGVYPEFGDGATRQTETANFLSEVNTVVTGAEAKNTDAEKVRYIHDTLCNRIEYNYDFINGRVSEDYAYTQSAYSVFCTDLTVCAGYSEAFQMVANAAGLDSMSVTSPGHQWNKVRVNDQWYNIDLTWADTAFDDFSGKEEDLIYNYYLRSDAFYDAEDMGDPNTTADDHDGHQEEGIWLGALPPCTADATPTQTGSYGEYIAPGTPVTPAATTAAPVITAKWTKSGYEYSITCATPGAKIYYVVWEDDDKFVYGDEPSCAATKSSIYKGTFKYKNITEIKAIAVCNGMYDSAVTTYLHTPTQNPIVYNLNGGTNHAENPATYTSEGAAITLKNPTKTGYTFAGWYKDAKYKTKVTKIASGTTGTVTLYAKWTPNTYTIKFAPNGGTGKMNNLTSRKYDTQYNLAANKFTKKGYRFLGWALSADGGVVYADKASVINLTETKGATVTLYAKWEKVTYTIDYVLNDGEFTGMEAPASSYTVDSTTITLEAPERLGYTFAGWYSDAKFKTKVTQLKQGSTGNKTFYAKWTPCTYNIVFNANGGTGTMKPMKSLKVDKEYTLTANAFKKTGYKFIGWSTTPEYDKNDENAVIIDNKAVISTESWMWDEFSEMYPDGTITCYAQWELQDYTITYKNGGDVNDNPATYNMETTNITLVAPTRVGYDFAGWYSDAKFKKPLKDNVLETFGKTGNKTVYAKWTPHQYTIKFDGNGATSGTMKELTGRKYGTAYALTANAFKRTNYTFVGWTVNENGTGTVYKNKEKVSNLTATDNGEVTLYAQWKPVEYKITYKNGGTHDNPTSYDVFADENIELEPATRTGYTFEGWYSDAKFKKPISELAVVGKKANITVYAKWTVHKYTINFDANAEENHLTQDVTGTTKPMSMTYGKKAALNANGFKAKGFKFLGWATEPDGEVVYTNKQKVSNLAAENGATVTLYAKWDIITYSIKYNMNGGTNNPSNPTSYNVASPIYLNNPTREGYTFEGWYTDKNLKKKLASTTPAYNSGTTGNKTFYAKWTAHKYLIKFEGNGAISGSMKDMSGVYGKSYTLTANAFKRPGYTFKGWATSENGAVVYNNKAKVSNLTAADEGIVTLYAVWERNTYTITYKGDTAGVSNPTSYNVDSATIVLNNPSKTGYTFDGWYKDSKYKTKVTEITAGSTGNITLYAKWTAHKYMIKFDKNGGTGSMKNLSVTYDKATKLTANAFKKSGYKFKGWNTKADGTGTTYTNKESIKNLTSTNGEVITLYAQWAPSWIN